MTDVVPGGKRRIDRVLDPGYLLGLPASSATDVRQRRDEALAELAELSRLGHQLDERTAMVTAEQRRRAAATFDAGTIPAAAVRRRRRGGQKSGQDAEATDEHLTSGRLARVFRLRADHDSPPTHRRRRRVERLVADVDLADVMTRTDDELARVLRTFRYERHQVTEVSARVRTVVDRCGDELGRRRVSAPPPVSRSVDSAAPEPDASAGPSADGRPGRGMTGTHGGSGQRWRRP